MKNTPIKLTDKEKIDNYLVWLQDQRHRIKFVFTNAGSENPIKNDQIICFQLSPPTDIRKALIKAIKKVHFES